MSQSSEIGPEPRESADVVLEIWLPPQLSARMTKVSKVINISPMVFLRKSLDLHRALRTDADGQPPHYPDMDHLHGAYRELQNNPVARVLYEYDVETLLGQYEEASTKHRLEDTNPTEAGFMSGKLTIPADLNNYVGERLFPIREPGYYISPQELVIAATCELVWLYTLAGTKPANPAVSPGQLQLY